MATFCEASRMLATSPPVNTWSATPFSSTLSIIRKASEILAPPRMKVQGLVGLSISSEMTLNSCSNKRPMAEGSTCSKPHNEGWSRCAAAKASQTYKSASGASLRTSRVSACWACVNCSFISNRVCSSARKRMLSSSSTSPSFKSRMVARAAGPHTSSMKPIFKPLSSRSTCACGSVV